MNALKDDFKAGAKAVYEALTSRTNPDYSIYGSAQPNYWRIGNVVDTIFDYLQMAVNSPSGDPCHLTFQQAQDQTTSIWDYYQTKLKTNNDACWYDDYCWWAISFAKAYETDYETVFTSIVRDAMQGEAVRLWDFINDGDLIQKKYGSPNVWQNCDQSVFASVKPLFENGLWQCDIFAEPRVPWCNPVNPATPIDLTLPGKGVVYNAATLGPYQNAVMNGLYFLLATRLASYGVIAMEIPDKVYGFLENWFSFPDPEKRLLHNFDSTTNALVRERVGLYEGGNPVNYYTPDSSWAGDQGLFIGGLVTYDKLRDQSAATFNPPYRQIASGVASKMNNMNVTESNGNVLPTIAYWYAFDNSLDPDKIPIPFNGDAGDYICGLGVCMRNLYFAYKNSVDVKIIMDEKYTAAMTNAAKAGLNYQTSFPFGNNVPLFAAFNGLASLITAIQCLP